MSLLDLYNMFVESLQPYGPIIAILLILLVSLVQISPLKLNPWTAIGKLLRYFGRIINKDILDRLDAVNDEIERLKISTNQVSCSVDDNEIDRIRWEILTFASNLQRGENFTRAEFDRIFVLNTKYHTILKRLGRENGQVDREMDYIRRVNKKKQDTNSYLK